MPQPSDPLRISTDQPIPARVLRVTPAGLIVVLPDGREGVVREREIGWDPTARQGWAERYKPDDTVQVVALGKGPDRRPEVSIRMAQSGSWAGIEKRYPIGSLASGLVTNIMPYGVFVELEPGITGLVHTSRFPSWPQQPPGDLFWPGDLVKVVIHAVEAKGQPISLSMAELTGRRWRDSAPVGIAHSYAATEPKGANPAHLTLDMLFSRLPLSVLVVEDDPGQRKSLVDWLRYAGQIAEEAGSTENAIERITSVQPDMVLMDVGLPGINGIEGVRQIKARWPEIRCVLMTDWGRAEHHAKDLQQLLQCGVSLLIKPYLPEDLVEALLEPTGNAGPLHTSASPARSILEQPRAALGKATQGELTETLVRLLSATRADKVVVFELDTAARQVKLLEQKGPATLNLESLPELIHSFMRDVAEDGQVAIARNAQEAADKRFLHLRPLLNFEACLGVPVSVQLRHRYALFLFFMRPTALSEAVLARTETAAAMVAVWLERRQFVKQAADLQRIVLSGQLSRALVHEISGRLTPINLALERLQSACNRVEQCAATDPDRVTEEIGQARQELQALSQQASVLVRTTRSFSRMARPGQEEIVRLEEVIGEVVDVLSDLAATAHVTVVARPATRLTFTRTQTTFLQQAMVNIVQNAIQQIHIVRPQQGGRVEISLTETSQDGQPMLRVSIEDDGPGIHRRLWDRIFEMDYTSRPEGSGLGLYISRSLIESQGGRIRVADSHVLWGATFVIEIPRRT